MSVVRVRNKPVYEPWCLDAGELRQQIVIQTAAIGSPDSRGKPTVTWPWDVAAASWATGVATITAAAAHGLAIGARVTLSGMTPVAWNGTFTVTAVPTATQFTVAIGSNPGATQALGIAITDPAIGLLVRCKIETPAGRKGEIGRQLVPSTTHIVTVRYRPFDVDLQRLVYKQGRVFNVGAKVDVDERHVRLELTCTEQE